MVFVIFVVFVSKNDSATSREFELSPPLALRPGSGSPPFAGMIGGCGRDRGAGRRLLRAAFQGGQRLFQAGTVAGEGDLAAVPA
ncbi:MAG TPA: hypothetical protein VIO94_06750, partial [Phenylobacterium sp.]